MYFFSGPKTVWSSGGNTWEQWGGNDKIVMWLDFAKSRTSNAIWEWWLSKINRIGFDSDGLAYWTKCPIHPRKFSFVIQWPVTSSLTAWWAIDQPTVLHFDPWKNEKRGAEPSALTAQHRFAKPPLSWDTTAPTCLTPFNVTTFDGLWTVVIPVSSTLSILSGLNPPLRDSTVARLS